MKESILALENDLDCSLALHESVAGIAKSIEKDGEFKLNHALELDNAIANLGAVTAFFESSKSRHKLSTEGIIESFFTTIGKVLEAIVRMIGKFINWLVGGTDSSDKAIQAKNAVKDINKNVDLSVIDQGVSLATESLALERDADINVPIKHIFEKWSTSLTDQEVDFITSGRRYNSIQNVLHHFTQASLPGFISGISYDIQTWMKDGFEKAKHTGKDDAVVAAFVRGKKAEFEKIKHNYSKELHVIDQMENESKMNEVQGVHTRLEYFLNKPSLLFPHLEKIWHSIDFRKISEQDRALIKELEKTRRAFESNVNTLKNTMGLSESNWPAMEGFTRAAHEANREIAKHISTLAHVCLFIKRSADIAYKATVKSFMYVRQIMNAISRIPNIDHDRLIKAHNAIQAKFNELDSMVAIAQ